jgi:excisionase family DNA binding protein
VGQERWYSIQEAADYLGISTVTLRRYIKHHRITTYRIAGRYRFRKSALDDFIEACRLGPSRRTTTHQEKTDGPADVDSGNPDRLQSSEHLADTVLREAPRQARSLYIQAFTASRLGHYREAEDLYRRIIDKHPHDGAAYYFLGLLYQDMEKQNLALEMWRQVIKLDRTSDLAKVAQYHITRALRET